MKPIYLDRVGSDMEVFLMNAAGEPVPSCGLIGGTKDNPRPVLGGNGFAVQEDNVMLEFNIPPAKEVTGFVTSFQQILDYIAKETAEKGLHINISPSMQFHPKDLRSRQAQHVGCEPDFNAYTKEMRRLSIEDLGDIRCAGGHVHVSFYTDPDSLYNQEGFPENDQREALVKALDVFLGLPSLFFDNDNRRRARYGKPGMFRPKEYGIEYRSLSNAWIKSPQLIEWVFNQVPKAVDLVNAGQEVPMEVMYAIEDDCRDEAEYWMKEFNVSLPEIAKHHDKIAVAAA